ncbi:hypothetical protein [Streptomyces flaveolus]|uniref:hypothetical protein n=1 Tax=Streptomyces flaveolus TaxID=67297 RepID=UPI0036FFD73A
MLAIVLHDSGRYPDTVMPVVIGDPLPWTAVAVTSSWASGNRLAELVVGFAVWAS